MEWTVTDGDTMVCFLLFIIVCMTHRSNNNKKNKQDIMALEYRKN